MQKIKVKTVTETEKDKSYYALLEISMEARKSYCIIVNDTEFVAEGIGNDIDIARNIFDMLCNGAVSSVNADEVIRDMKIEFFV